MEMKAVRSILFLFIAQIAPAKCFFVRKHVYVGNATSWTEVQKYCRDNHVDLSTVNTPEDLTRFRRDIVGHVSKWVWIGLSKQPTEKNFTQWSDGSLLGTVVWERNEPNRPDSEHCVELRDGQMNDYNCSRNVAFSCYIWEPRMVLVQEMKTWLEALEHCRKFYTDLISLNTEDDLFAANQTSLSSKTPRVWTGLRLLDGSWFWVNEEPLGNLTNLPLCPARPWHCGAKTVGEDALENTDCEEKLNFICYKQSP